MDSGIFFDTGVLYSTALLCVTVALFYYYCTRNNDYWKRKKVPYIKPEFFFGNIKAMLTFKESQPEVLSRLYETFKEQGYGYGGLFHFVEPILLVGSPTLIKDMCIKNFPAFHDRGLTCDEKFDPLSAHLVQLNQKKWKYLRAKLTPTFASGKLKAMLPIIAEAVEHYMAVLEKLSNSEEDAEFREIVAQFATDVIGTCAFGLQLNALQDKNCNFRKMGRKVFEPTKWDRITQTVRNSFPLLYKLFRFRMYSKEISDFFISSVKSTIEYRIMNKIQRNDFIELLMQMRNTKVSTLQTLDGEELAGIDNYNTNVEEGVLELTDEVLAAQAFIFFLGGFETTSSTMSFLLQEIAKRKDVQEKLAAEATAVREKYGGFTYEALQKLNYMQQVINETLRMYPPITVLMRCCNRKYQIPDTDVVIEPGTRVFIPIWAIHRDSDLYPDPNTFDPDRWSDDNKHNINMDAFLPFGSGPRICIGSRFGTLEMKVALANMICKYQVAPCSKTRPFAIDPRSFLLAPKHGIWLNIRKRLQANHNVK